MTEYHDTFASTVLTSKRASKTIVKIYDEGNKVATSLIKNSKIQILFFSYSPEKREMRL